MTERRRYEWDVPIIGSGTKTLLHLDEQGGEAERAESEERARARDEADLDGLRHSSAVRALVTPFIRMKKGRTAEIPVRCGTRDVGEMVTSGVAFGIREEAVELILVRRSNEQVHMERATGPRTMLGVEHYICSCNGFRPGHLDYVTIPRLYRAGLEALARTAKDGRVRPVVNLHSLLHTP